MKISIRIEVDFFFDCRTKIETEYVNLNDTSRLGIRKKNVIYKIHIVYLRVSTPSFNAILFRSLNFITSTVGHAHSIYYCLIGFQVVEMILIVYSKRTRYLQLFNIIIN